MSAAHTFPPQDNRPPPLILSLSTELISEIAEYAALLPGVLLNLRQTCRDLHARTLQVVAKRYFEDRAFLIKHPGSLATLCEISQHSVFSKSMKRLRFSLAFLHYFYVRRHPTYGARITGSAFTEVEQAQFESAHRELQTMVAAFHKNDYALALIRETLINFRNKGTVLAISLTDEIIKGDEWGFHQLRHALGCPPIMLPDCQDFFKARPFAILLRAIEGADYPITDLDLGTWSQGVMSSFLDPHVPDGISRYEPYRHLRSLRLCTGNVRLSPRDTEHSSTMRRQSLVQFFSHLVNLEHLALTCKVWQFAYLNGACNDPFISALIEAARIPSETGSTLLGQLRSLYLSGFYVDFDGLRDLVESTRDTLESLDIRRLVSVVDYPVGFEGILRRAHGRMTFHLKSEAEENLE